MSDIKSIALVTGANRGIGREVASQLAKLGHKVIIGSRTLAKGLEVKDELNSQGLDVEAIELDVSNADSIQKAYQEIMDRYSRLDILVNNAGIIGEGSQSPVDTYNSIADVFKTNTMGPYLLDELFLPSMLENGYGRIVHVSSGMGQLHDMGTGYLPYRMSKTGLSVLTRYFSNLTEGKNIKVNSVCPGWVQTDMGGSNAARTIPQGAETIVWAATLDESGENGKFFRDKKVIPW